MLHLVHDIGEGDIIFWICERVASTRAGMSKADVQNWLLERCGRTGAELTSMGKAEVARKSFRGEYEGDEAFHPFLAGPTSIPVIVAGAKNAAISMVVGVSGPHRRAARPPVVVGARRRAIRAGGAR